MNQMLYRTPLHEAHVRLGARLTPFAGWEMPLSYRSILEEARSVRHHVGIFDISHMGRLKIVGRDAASLLQFLTTNDVKALSSGMAHYSLLANQQGGIKDDIIVYKMNEDEFLVVVNASNTAKDIAWIESFSPQTEGEGVGEELRIENITPHTAMIAVQGPKAETVLATALDTSELKEIERFAHRTIVVKKGGVSTELLCCRTGYTGEDGFELIVSNAYAQVIWEGLLAVGATPCGLGARDTLRIEAGYPLYGHEIDEDISPVEAGLMWVVKLEKGDFIGREAIIEGKRLGPRRRLMGLLVRGRALPRQGYTIYHEDQEVGVVTSGTFSPHREASIALGFLNAEVARPHLTVEIDIRGQRHTATVVPKKELLQKPHMEEKS
ncbi:glycine cleavage system T protein [Chthonomonas calidirosea]|uniref:glycine cleavage system aminomethyltransferase GcvT n=1 Tax=Chthonomonas calidirosea TaxID=454171 RepID=UPI0006DD3FBB|nr:glycine cleavage system T protein [Chthonomonas calidirosea]